MRPHGGILLCAVAGACACSLSFGTTGTWSDDPPPPVSLVDSTSVVTSEGKSVFFGGFDPQSRRPLNQVLVFDPKANVWRQGAPMPEFITGYAAAGLSNGDVLIAGGGGVLGVGALPVAGNPSPNSGNGGLQNSTWLYDPDRNKWTKVGDLNVARSSASAVRLSDGRILIAGGTVEFATPIQLPDGTTSAFGFSSSAEMFDPQADRWTLVGSLHVARGAMALVALPSGKALAAGGCAFANRGFIQGGALATTEIFDPTQESWALARPLPQPLCAASGLTLRDGRVLLTSGSVEFLTGSSAQAIVYDPTKRVWSNVGTIVPGAGAPILLPDGRVFVSAVQAGPIKGRVASLLLGGQLFDSTTDNWSFVTSNPAVVSSRIGLQESLIAIPKSPGVVMVLLANSNQAFDFDPSRSPTSAVVLDSSGLTIVLVILAVTLCLWLAAKLFQARRIEYRRPA